MAILGEKGILFIWDIPTLPAVPAYKPVACLTSQSLATAVSMIESRTKCFPGVVKKQPSLFSYTISAEGEYIDTTTVGGDTTKKSHDALLLLQMTKQKINWKIDTDITNGTSTKYYGSAYINDLSLDQGAGDEFSTFSLSLDGDGDILFADPMV